MKLFTKEQSKECSRFCERQNLIWRRMHKTSYLLIRNKYSNLYKLVWLGTPDEQSQQRKNRRMRSLLRPDLPKEQVDAMTSLNLFVTLTLDDDSLANPISTQVRSFLKVLKKYFQGERRSAWVSALEADREVQEEKDHTRNVAKIDFAINHHPKKLEYIWVAEYGHDTNRIHVHLLCNAGWLPTRFKNRWGSNLQCKTLDNVITNDGKTAPLLYLLKYMVKPHIPCSQIAGFTHRRFGTSRTFKAPASDSDDWDFVKTFSAIDDNPIDCDIENEIIQPAEAVMNSVTEYNGHYTYIEHHIKNMGAFKLHDETKVEDIAERISDWDPNQTVRAMYQRNGWKDTIPPFPDRQSREKTLETYFHDMEILRKKVLKFNLALAEAGVDLSDPEVREDLSLEEWIDRSTKTESYARNQEFLTELEEIEKEIGDLASSLQGKL